MRKAIFVAATALFAVSVSAKAQAPDTSRAQAVAPVKDSFLGLDKPKHFILSFFLESGSFAVVQAAGGSRHTALIGASALTSVFGIGREVHDRRTKGLFSLGDLAWDAIGAGTAAVMLRHTYR